MAAELGPVANATTKLIRHLMGIKFALELQDSQDHDEDDIHVVDSFVEIMKENVTRLEKTLEIFSGSSAGLAFGILEMKLKAAGEYVESLEESITTRRYLGYRTGSSAIPMNERLRSLQQSLVYYFLLTTLGTTAAHVYSTEFSAQHKETSIRLQSGIMKLYPVNSVEKESKLETLLQPLLLTMESQDHGAAYQTMKETVDEIKTLRRVLESQRQLTPETEDLVLKLLSENSDPCDPDIDTLPAGSVERPSSPPPAAVITLASAEASTSSGQTFVEKDFEGTLISAAPSVMMDLSMLQLSSTYINNNDGLCRCGDAVVLVERGVRGLTEHLHKIESRAKKDCNNIVASEINLFVFTMNMNVQRLKNNLGKFSELSSGAALDSLVVKLEKAAGYVESLDDGKTLPPGVFTTYWDRIKEGLSSLRHHLLYSFLKGVAITLLNVHIHPSKKQKSFERTMLKTWASGSESKDRDNEDLILETLIPPVIVPVVPEAVKDIVQRMELDIRKLRRQAHRETAPVTHKFFEEMLRDEESVTRLGEEMGDPQISLPRAESSNDSIFTPCCSGKQALHGSTGPNDSPSEALPPETSTPRAYSASDSEGIRTPSSLFTLLKFW